MAAHDLVRMTVSGTPGTGTITLLAADTGALTFALGGVLDGERITYGIVDGNNHEVGVGIYTATGTTLTRPLIRASTNAGAAVSLTSAAKVYITNSANDQWMNGFAYCPGRYYSVTGQGFGGNVCTANTIFFKAFYLPARITVSEVSYCVSTTVTGNHIIGVYANNARYFSPTGAPLFTTGSTVNAANILVSTAGLPITFDAGVYWIAMNSSAAGLCFMTNSAGGMVDLMTLVGMGQNNVIQFGSVSSAPSKPLTFGALPTLTGNPSTDTITFLNDNKVAPCIQFLAS